MQRSWGDDRKVLVSRHSSLYQAWPDIVLSNSGKLIVTFMRCVHHSDRSYTALCLTESTDRGRSWSEPQVLVEAPGNPYWNCARISKLRDGRLAIVCDRIIERETGASQVFLWFSDDEGDSWQGPFPTPAEGIVPTNCCSFPVGAGSLPPTEPVPSTAFRGAALVFR